MRLRRLSTRSKVATSKAQKSAGVTVPDLSNRVTTLEMSNTDMDGRIYVLEALASSGYTGTISVIESVNFSTQNVVSKTLTYSNGKLMEVL